MVIRLIHQHLIAMAAPLVLGGLLAACGSSLTLPKLTIPSTPAPSSATPTPTPGTATSSPIPTTTHISGFQVASVTFVSTQDGWVLGTAPCGSGSCLAIARTQDGGASWSSVTPPPTSYSGAGGSGISAIRFADTQDGWAYGGQLWATHDAGTTWSQISLPGLSAGSGTPAIQELEASGGYVQAVYFGSSGFLIATSPVGTDSWLVSATTLAFGGGPVPVAQLVLQGSSGWIVENDRVVVRGARLQSGSWAAWTPPCATVEGPATLAASSPQDLIAVCDDGLWGGVGGSNAERAYVSSNGGASFTQLLTALPSACQGAALASPSSSVAATGCGGTIEGTFNGGSTWTGVYSAGGAISYLGFTTSSQGVAIQTAGSSSLGSLLMTTDGGHSWAPVII